jgi:hypothetical protein rflaF_20676
LTSFYPPGFHYFHFITLRIRCQVLLYYIKDNIDDNPEITVEYFVPDEKKSGGVYLTLNDRVRIIDEYERSIVFVSGKKVMIDDIYGINLR